MNRKKRECRAEGGCKIEIRNGRDWDAIHEEYIAGGASYRELAEKYGVSLKALSREARSGEWVEQRRRIKLSGTKAGDAAPGSDEGKTLGKDNLKLFLPSGEASAKENGMGVETTQSQAAYRLWTDLENMDEAGIATGIRRKALLILDRMFDEWTEISATEQRFVEDGVTNVRKLRDMTAIYKELTGSVPKGEETDIEDLSPLAELLKEDAP